MFTSSSEAAASQFPLRGATRDLLTLLAHTNSIEETIQLLARRLSQSGQMSTRLLYEYVLDRPPDNGALATRPIENIERALRSFIECDEYKYDIARRVMQSFPEYRRDFFLHIPKSGGTTALAAMGGTGQYISLPTKQWLSDGNVPDFLGFLREIGRDIANKGKTIFTMHGHLTARDLIAAGTKRFEDSIFTVVRDPGEIVYSLLNYMLERLEEASGNSHCTPDVTLWRNMLGVDANFAPSKENNIDALARRLFGRNTVCAFLGSDGTASSAMDNILRLGVEVVQFKNLREYLAKRGWNHHLHANRSNKFSALQEIGIETRIQIQQGISEDVKLYQMLRKNWEK